MALVSRPVFSFSALSGYQLAPELETALLGALVRTPWKLAPIKSVVDAKCFSLQPLQLLWDLLLRSEYTKTREAVSMSAVTGELQRLKARGQITFPEMLKLGVTVRDAVRGERVPFVQLMGFIQEPIFAYADRAWTTRSAEGVSNRDLKAVRAVSKERMDAIDFFEDPEEVLSKPLPEQATWLNISDAIEHVEEIKTRLRTGIGMLDTMLSQGVPPQSLSMFLAGTGGGKTCALVHVAVASVYEGKNVFYASLEMTRSDIAKRLIACESNRPFQNITRANYERTAHNSRVASIGFASFAPHEKITEIMQAMEDWEAATGKRVDVLVLDYADLVMPSSYTKYEGSYEMQGRVFNALRQWAVQGNRWVWTAAQASRLTQSQAKSGGAPGLHQMGESMKKAHLSDLVVSVGRNQEGWVALSVIKSRYGSTGDIVPFPEAFDCARLGHHSVVEEACGLVTEFRWGLMKATLAQVRAVERTLQNAKSSGANRRAQCPICVELTGKADRKGALSANMDRGVFHCFKCGVSGRFWVAGKKWTKEEAEKEEIHYGYDPPEGFTLLEYARDVLTFAPALEHLESRGVTDEIAAQAQIGVCAEGRFSGRVIVPVIDKKNHWRWYVGRTWGDQEPKYLYPKGDRRDVLYNAKALDVETDVPVFVVEGCFDAIAHYPNAVAVLGKASNNALNQLILAKRPVVFVYDGDAWNEAYYTAVTLRAWGKKDCAAVWLPAHCDPDDVPREELMRAAYEALNHKFYEAPITKAYAKEGVIW